MEYFTQCSVCKKFLINGIWQDRPDIALAYPDRISHGYCPKCYEKEMKKMAIFFKKTKKDLTK